MYYEYRGLYKISTAYQCVRCGLKANTRQRKDGHIGGCPVYGIPLGKEGGRCPLDGAMEGKGE